MVVYHCILSQSPLLQGTWSCKNRYQEQPLNQHCQTRYRGVIYHPPSGIKTHNCSGFKVELELLHQGKYHFSNGIKKNGLSIDLEISVDISIPGSGLLALYSPFGFSHLCGFRDSILPSGECLISDINHSVSIFHLSIAMPRNILCVEESHVMQAQKSR